MGQDEKLPKGKEGVVILYIHNFFFSSTTKREGPNVEDVGKAALGKTNSKQNLSGININKRPLKPPAYQLCTPSHNILCHRKMFFYQEGLFFLPSHKELLDLALQDGFPHPVSLCRVDYKSHAYTLRLLLCPKVT